MSQPSKKQSQTITSRIQELMGIKGIKPYRICKDIGMPEITFHRSSKTPDKWKLQHLIKIAEYFKVSLDYLASGNTNNNSEILRAENQSLKEENKRLKERVATYESVAHSIINQSEKKQKLIKSKK